MRRNHKPGTKSNRRYRKFAWIFGSSAMVIALLYWEQVAVLYVLSTLAMCAVLLIVAFSNLEAKDNELHEAARRKIDAVRDEHSTRSTSRNKRAA